ncbi:hypothetical protein [Spiroplasma poulsonii]|uniref:hypothetical protein n=1 Tax=Spiroplasma poulsonii TaxID=2138 RepID=UPI001F4C9C61|nr:hypothetical protein [Spiroplasma poulsonii]UNF62101.1 hypothetical protein MNU24_01150 [Spiroplasma poulsonii]
MFDAVELTNALKTKTPVSEEHDQNTRRIRNCIIATKARKNIMLICYQVLVTIVDSGKNSEY